MNIPRLSYEIATEVSANGGTISSILALVGAFYLGAERYGLALSLLGISLLIDNIITRIWVWLLRHR